MLIQLLCFVTCTEIESIDKDKKHRNNSNYFPAIFISLLCSTTLDHA